MTSSRRPTRRQFLKRSAGLGAALTLPLAAPAFSQSKPFQGQTLNVSCWNAPYPKLLLEYLPILIFIGLAGIMGGALIVVPLIVAPSKPDPEKLSAYECGFPAFGDARMKFDVRFYLVSILFIIFDLEVAFLFPWAISLKATGAFGFWSMVAFLAVLTVGFIYEWKKGALEWE